MSYYRDGDVSIYFEEYGSGFPLLLLAGGGLNSSIGVWSGESRRAAPINAIAELQSEFRCIALDQRNSVLGCSSGPLELDDPWAGYADDHLGLMDHVGADRFLVLGSCIAGPFIFKLIELAPERVVAAVICQSVGESAEAPGLCYESASASWVPQICAHRPEVTREMALRHVDRLYRANPDFVFSVSRDFARACTTPVFVVPDDIPVHPWQVSMDIFKLVPSAQVSIYPWESPERAPILVEQIKDFLRAHDPTREGDGHGDTSDGHR
jgi:pimeloyl-ACP methyl ester carboxylesterase